MSLFVTFAADSGEYLLKPAGYAALVVFFILLLAAIRFLGKSESKRMKTRQLVYCAVAMALAIVTSFIKFASLPFGGSITLFSMMFICLIGYFYGLKTGLITGLAYGVLQFVTDPYIFAPLQVLLDFPLAFMALGLSGLFSNKKHGLITGYLLGVFGRYVCHVISGYIFFAAYAPEDMNPFLYTLGYNATYILPEAIVTVIVLCLPPMHKTIARLKTQALDS